MVNNEREVNKKKTMKPSLFIGLGKNNTNFKSSITQERFKAGSPTSGFDLSDPNEKHLYLSKIALDSNDVLIRLGVFIKQALTVKKAI